MRYLRIEIFFVISLLFFAACKEGIGTIGLGIQPPDEFLGTDYFDTTTIVAYSTIHDSMATSNVTTNVLGCLNDPVFGKTTAGVYTQFRLSNYISATSEDFVGAVADSLVLTLVCAGYYGDTLNSFKINVYELEDSLSKTETYYTTSSLKYKGSSLTENPNLYISPRPNTKQDTSSSPYYVRILLNKSLADEFISKVSSGVYATDAAFLKYFKGLYLEASDMTGNGCMVSLNMTNEKSKLTLYYSKDTTHSEYTFKTNESTAHFGVFKHDYKDDFKSKLGDSISAKVLYAQAGAGIKTVLHFPNLKEKFENQKVIIHRAVLVISHEDDALANYLPPNSLWITAAVNDSTAYFLPDYFLGSQNDGYFGGTYNQTKKEYSFHITQYIQNLVEGKSDNYLLSLTVTPTVTHFSRLMMYGTNPADTNKRLKLKINYTIIK